MPNKFQIQLPSAGENTFDDETGSIFFIGTATVIIRFAGFTILTDPNFLHAGDHVHLGYGLTSERLTEPAIDIGELPEIDFCVLSHYHGDHFDRIAEEKLRKDLPIITTEHAAEELKSKGFARAVALETWDAAVIHKNNSIVNVTSLPGQHGPGIVDFALPPVMGSILEFEDKSSRKIFRIFISGDTLLIDELKEIPRRFPEIDIGLFHLGGTQVLGIMVTMDAEQGAKAVELIDPDVAIPIHYNDYDVFKSPLEDFKIAAERAGLNEKMVYLAHGDTYNFSFSEK